MALSSQLFSFYYHNYFLSERQRTFFFLETATVMENLLFNGLKNIFCIII